MVIPFSGLPILGPHATCRSEFERWNVMFPQQTNHKLVLQTLQNNQRNRFIAKPLYFRKPTWTFDPQNAGSLGISLMLQLWFFGCPASNLGLVAGWKPWMQGISTINLKWQKISGAGKKHIVGICHRFAMVYLYSVFTVNNHFRNASTDHLNVPQSPGSLNAFAMDFSTKKCQSWRSGSMASHCVILKPFKYVFPWEHIGVITH